MKVSKSVQSFSLTLALTVSYLISPAQHFNTDSLAHTFSIVARDSVTGEMGVAVQSHWFAVGSDVAWGKAGVGVIATQSFINISFGQKGLELLEKGKSPKEVVDILVEADKGRDGRQLAVLDSKGLTATWTGRGCIPEAGHIVENNFSVQANMMVNDRVWVEMAKAFKKTKAPLAERLIAALEAGQQAGGDIRGKQSACILIVKATNSGNVWEDRYIDLRVDDNAEPIKELKRLLNIFRAYELIGNGNTALEKGDFELASKVYNEVDKMYPDNEEIKFWRSIRLTNKGKFQEAMPLFREVFKRNSNWITLTKRLVKIGLLNTTEENLNKIYSLADK